MCLAETNLPPDIGAALDIDVAGARRLGSQLVCPPPRGASQFELVTALDSDEVVFAEFVPNQTLTLHEVTGRFGNGREVPTGAHGLGVTVIFNEVWPSGAPRACAVLARVEPGRPPHETVRSVTLYLRPAPTP
jgi:hypothetical protein